MAHGNLIIPSFSILWDANIRANVGERTDYLPADQIGRLSFGVSKVPPRWEQMKEPFGAAQAEANRMVHELKKLIGSDAYRDDLAQAIFDSWHLVKKLEESDLD